MQKTDMSKRIKERSTMVFWAVMVMLILPVSLAKVADIDIWWHMQYGRSMIEHFSLPNLGDYYFSPVNQNLNSLRYTWLGNILLHLLYAGLGEPGLQLLRILFVLGACMLLRSVAGKQHRGWQLLVLAAFVLGSYQKQIIRNSLFALILTPLILWLWHLAGNREKEKWLWLYPLILGVWSCLHGSYLLGFGLVLLLLGGDTVDMLIGTQVLDKKKILRYLLILVLSFSAVSVWNPTTMSYLSRFPAIFKAPEKKVQAVSTPSRESKTEKQEDQNTQFGLLGEKYPELNIKPSDFAAPGEDLSQGVLGKIKHKLNNTVFKNSGPFQSVEFMSPFDKLDRLYVKVALIFGVFGFIVLLWKIRPLKMSVVLPFTAVFLTGCGYLRLVGYIPILSAFVIFLAFRSRPSKNETNVLARERPMWIIAFCVLGALWVNCFAGYPVYIGTEHHSFGWGRIPTYSKKFADRVFKISKGQKTFTTLANGGYLLYQWYPEKKVFIDGRFASHDKDVLLAYRIMSEKNINPDFLTIKYGIKTAVIEHTTGSVLNNFCLSENWYAALIDEGMIYFTYDSDYEDNIPLPEVLFDESQFNALPRAFKTHLAQTLHTVLNSLYKKGRIKDGNRFLDKYTGIFKAAEPFVDKRFLDVTQTLKTSGRQIYGNVNSRAMYWEFKHNAALEMKDDKKIIEYGLKVLEKAPHRLPVLLNISVSYANLEEMENSFNALEKLQRNITDENRAFIGQNRRLLASLYWRLSEFFLERDDPLKAYGLAEMANDYDPKIISDIRLYQTFSKVVIACNKSNEYALALKLLAQMEDKFKSTPRWLNDMAWQLLITGQPGKDIILRAQTYAQKAVEQMELEKNPQIDFAYDTLAEIYFKQGKRQLGCKSMEKALSAAPETRKQFYQEKQCR